MASINMMATPGKGAFSMNINMPADPLGKKLKKAQFALDTQVFADCEPLMPMQTGIFIFLSKARSVSLAGTGKVIVGSPPMGRFLYYGKVMVDPQTGSPWARKGAKKVVTARDLVLNRGAHPDAQAKWFEVAKRQHKDEWINMVGKILGGK